MSRYATAIDMNTWKVRHPKRKSRKGRKARRKGYTPAGAIAGADDRRDRERDRDRDRDRREDDELDEDEDDLEGWEGDLEADVDADLDDHPDDEPFEPGDEDDVGALRIGRRRREAPPRSGGPFVRLRQAVGPKWAKPVALGANLQVRARKGFRAAVVEVKPGLFVVAEVPQAAVEFGFGPLLLAPALVKTLSRAFKRSQAGEGATDGAQRPELPSSPPPRQLTGPTEDSAEGRLPRWVDGDVAEELGCGTCRKRERS